MNILAMSDIHSRFQEFIPDKKYDLILIAGDITNFGDYAEYNKALDWFLELSYYGPVYFIGGNHDINIWPFAREIEARKLGVFIQDQHRITIERYSIQGMNLSPCYDLPILATRWTNMTYERWKEEAYYSLKEYSDIAVSHCPPLGYLDAGLGSKGLANYIEDFQPKLVVCGHIHEQSGQSNIGKTLIINTACKMTEINL